MFKSKNDETVKYSEVLRVLEFDDESKSWLVRSD